MRVGVICCLSPEKAESQQSDNQTFCFCTEGQSVENTLLSAAIQFWQQQKLKQLSWVDSGEVMSELCSIKFGK